MKTDRDARPEPHATTALSEHVAQNIETIAHLHTLAEGKVGRNQRTIERLTASIGHPWALNGIVAAAALWICFNMLAPRLGCSAPDAPPFPWMQGARLRLGILARFRIET